MILNILIRASTNIIFISWTLVLNCKNKNIIYTNIIPNITLYYQSTLNRSKINSISQSEQLELSTSLN